MNDATQPERTVTPGYVWFDTEFTGLDTADAHLLEVAMVMTDTSLRRIADASADVRLCVRLDREAHLSDWVRQNLAALLDRCRSSEAMPVSEVDLVLAARVDGALGRAPADPKLRPVLAGNTVHMDAALARRLLPEFSRRLHYRLLDVSTLKTFWNDSFAGQVFNKEDVSMIRDWLPAGFSLPAAAAHDAYYDVHATLAEMNYYRRHLGAGKG
jgi:oligoribonuclease